MFNKPFFKRGEVCKILFTQNTLHMREFREVARRYMV
ncbi:unnamed protein product [Schistosoma mattheei]|uniref:Uncharacterized protein n=1 Tax=Schistosoma mattheei TaxID=31246 RepID=A0A3P8G8B3_9TREM|nr:unnamed protein product [Schistosoma mattheei]